MTVQQMAAAKRQRKGKLRLLNWWRQRWGMGQWSSQSTWTQETTSDRAW